MAWNNISDKNAGDTVTATDQNQNMENARVLGGNGTSAPSTDIETIHGQIGSYSAGNASGEIPISNGTVNTDLNADKLDGYDKEYYEPYCNYIYNPDGNIDQDGNSGSTAANGEYYLDTLYVIKSSTGNEPTYTINRNTTVGEGLEVNDLSESAIELNVSVGSTGGAGQDNRIIIRAPDWDAKYNNDYFTHVVRFKIPIGVTFTMGLRKISSSETDVELVGTGEWGEVVLTNPPDSSGTELRLSLYLPSTLPIGSYYFKQMRLYKGSDYKPYIPRGFQGDLEKCMSVYERSYDYGVAPASNITTGMSTVYPMASVLTRGQIAQASLSVRKLSSASYGSGITIYSQDGTTNNVSQYNLSTTKLPIDTILGESDRSIGYELRTSGSMTTGTMYVYHWVYDVRP